MLFFVDWDWQTIYQVSPDKLESFIDHTLDTLNRNMDATRAAGLINNDGFRLLFWDGAEFVR